MDLLLNFIWQLVWWFISLIIYMGMITTLLLVTVWSLLIICRIFKIPWIDGTLTGYINRE